MSVDTLPPLPSYDDVQVVVPAPGAGPGNWAGAASAVLVDGTFWLTWRVRRPLTEGRGVSVVVARSADGVTFEEVAECRPRGVRLRVVRAAGAGAGARASAGGSTSRARPPAPSTGGSTASPPRRRRSCPPASAGWCCPATTGSRSRTRSSSPRRRADGWGMWLCCHPLTDAGHEDRMTTRLLTSPDGLAWTDRGEVLAGRPGALGRPRRPGDDGARRRPARGAVRRPRRRRLQLVRDDRRRPLGRRAAGRRRRATRSPRRTPTARGATPPPCRCPTAAPASTSRPRAPTARTTWSRWSADGVALSAGWRSSNEPFGSRWRASRRSPAPVSSDEQPDVVGEVRGPAARAAPASAAGAGVVAGRSAARPAARSPGARPPAARTGPAGRRPGPPGRATVGRHPGAT